MKTFLQGVGRRLGYEVSRRRPGLVDFLHERGVKTVIDVGANQGQFGLWLRARGYRGNIVSFEPTNSSFEILKERAAKDAKWEVHRAALGAEIGHAMINVSKYSEFSSLQEVTPAAAHFDPRSVTVLREQIEIRRFDDLRVSDLSHTLLKIDTQGFEKQVLTGAKRSLAALCAIQMELPIVHFYKETWHIGTALEFMRENGFVLSQIQPVNFSSRDPCSLVEVDALFRRYDEEIDT